MISVQPPEELNNIVCYESIIGPKISLHTKNVMLRPNLGSKEIDNPQKGYPSEVYQLRNKIFKKDIFSIYLFENRKFLVIWKVGD